LAPLRSWAPQYSQGQGLTLIVVSPPKMMIHPINTYRSNSEEKEEKNDEKEELEKELKKKIDIKVSTKF
jgi:hypothetical protein